MEERLQQLAALHTELVEFKDRYGNTATPVAVEAHKHVRILLVEVTRLLTQAAELTALALDIHRDE